MKFGFALKKSVAAAASFVYSSHIGLSAQMSILAVFGIFGTACFCLVEWAHRRNAALQQSNDEIAAKLNTDQHSDWIKYIFENNLFLFFFIFYQNIFEKDGMI